MFPSNPRFVLAFFAVSSFGNFLVSVDGKCKIEPVDGHVDWPSKKKTIKKNAFKKCKELRTISISPEVESIHNTAFYKSGLDLTELQNYGRSPNNMTVNVQIVSDGLYDQHVTLLLYMSDKLIADAPATLAAVEFSVIPETQSSFLIVLRPDMTVRQCGSTWEEMVDPSFYVSLDVGKSSLTYKNGPVFGVVPGSTVELVLKSKFD
mmetsp:Transcript_7531/g.8630  ORF Transcript_7531/g.8630 Transcript_7531/m.8630 type:complete len:206 (+) Transcript_7531:62-679(+)